MIRISTLTFFVLMSLKSFSQSDALAYLDLIGEQYKKFNHEMMTYTSAVNHGKSARKVEKRRNELMAQVKESEITIRKMKPYNGVSTLRDSMAAYFKMSGVLLNRDYGKIVDLEDIAEQSYDAMEAYLMAKEKAEEKLDVASGNAKEQYDKFAAENNIKLIKNESELNQKIAKTNKVSTYTNQVYLLFFKSYKNEAYLMDAMRRDDLTALEQSRNALSSSATEDLAKSNSLGIFNGDASLKAALQQALSFYKTEADQKMKVYTDYLISKDNFEKMKKSMDSTPASKRTKENIDAYNKAVADFNKKVEASNANNQELNKKRSTVIKNWNEAYDDFLARHTPKYK